MKLDEVESRLKENVEWDKVCFCLDKTQNNLNSHSNRFIKGDVVAKAIEVCSNKKVPFLNKLGYDNIIEGTDVKIEVRSEKTAVLAGGAIKANLKVKNGMGATTEFNPPDNWFLLVVRSSPPYKIALMDARTVKDNCKYQGNEVVMDSGCTDYRLIHESTKTYGGEEVKEIDVAGLIVEGLLCEYTMKTV